MAIDLDDIKRRMEAGLESFRKELLGLRTGRASPSLLDPIRVDAYGSKMPLNQVGTVNTPEPRLLVVQVWDGGMTKAVEKAIRDSDLGLNPMVEGQIIRIPLPELSAERRQELVKVAKKYAEEAKVAVRNVRRHGMDMLKKAQKDGDITEDEEKKLSDQIQKLTDQTVEKVDQAQQHKEKEILDL